MRAAREQFRRLRRALDILSRDAADQIVGKVLEQANAAALWREVQISRDARLRIAVGEKIGGEIGRRTEQIDMLDPPGDLGFGRRGKLEFVENITCFTGVTVRVPQPIEKRAWIVRAWRGQLLMSGLEAKGRGHCRKARV